MADGTPFPFIVGSGRSGTTLLRKMLEQHPALAIPPESYFPISLDRRRTRYESAHGFDLDKYRADLWGNVRFVDWDMDPAFVRERLSGIAPIDFPEAVRRTYAAYAESREKPRYADKTPPFVRHMERLSTMFPEAIFVHIVRDGRDVALSLVQQRWGPRRTAHAAELWSTRVRRGRAAGLKLGPARYHEIRYEDMLDDPEAKLGAVCDFIDLDYRAEMLAYQGTWQDGIPSRLQPQHAGLAKPPTKGLRNWRTQMRPGDLAVFEAIAGDALEEFGYQRALDRIPAPAKARASVGTARNAVVRAGRRARARIKGRLPAPADPAAERGGAGS